MNKRGFWAGSGLVLMAAAGFGFHSSLVKQMFIWGSNPVQVIFYEFVLASLLFGTVIHSLRLKIDLKWNQMVTVLVWGGIGVGGTGISLYAAVERIPVALAIVLLFNYVPWVFLLEYLKYGIKPSPRRWVALVLILFGTVLMTDLFNSSWDDMNGVGIGLALLGALCYGSFIFGARQLGGIGTPLIRSYIICVGICLFFGLWGLLAPAAIFIPPEVPPLPFWGMIVLLTIMGQIIPIFSFSRAIPMIGGSLAAILASVELPIASLAAFILLGEILRPIQWIGLLGIAAAVVIANWKQENLV